MSDKIEAENIRVSRMCEIIAEQEALESKKTMTASEEARHRRLSQEFSVLKADVSVEEFARHRTSTLTKELGGEVPTISRDRAEQWRSFIKSGAAEFRDSLAASAQWGDVTGETDSGTSGVLVPASYDARVFNVLGQYDEVVLDAYSNVFTTKTRSACTTPLVDDSAAQSPVAFASSTKLGAAVQTPVTPTRAGAVAWGECPQYRSGRFLLALELERDTFASTVSLLEATINQRHALAFGAQAIANITGALTGVQNNTSASSTLAHLDFLNTAKLLPRVYRRNAVWLMHNNTQFALITSLESTGRSMIDPSGNSFLGRPIAVCDSLNAPTAGASAVALLVDPTYLLQRRVEGGTFMRRSVQTSSGIAYDLAEVE